MCHEISGQWRTCQSFSPLPDNSVKLGSLGLDMGNTSWDISGSLFLYLFLNTLMVLQPQIDIIIVFPPLVYDNNLT